MFHHKEICYDARSHERKITQRCNPDTVWCPLIAQGTWMIPFMNLVYEVV